MNREIKFRGLDEHRGFVFGSLFKNDFATRILPFGAVIFDDNQISDHTIVDEKTVGQFTGLKDNNGKEIYEGDILGRLGLSKFRIEFFDGMFCAFENSEESNQNNAHRIDWLISTYKLEVIGNIYQNTEILNS